MNLPGTYISNRSLTPDSQANMPTCHNTDPAYDGDILVGRQFNATNSNNGKNGHVDNYRLQGEDEGVANKVVLPQIKTGLADGEYVVPSAFIARGTIKKFNNLNNIKVISTSPVCMGEPSPCSDRTLTDFKETICEYDTIAAFPKFSEERELSQSNDSIQSIACLSNGVFTTSRHTTVGTPQPDTSADAKRQFTPTISIYNLNSPSSEQLDLTSSTNHLVEDLSSSSNSSDRVPSSRPSPKSKGAAMLKSLRSRGKKTLSLSNLLPQKNQENVEPVKAVKFKSFTDHQNSNVTHQCPSPRNRSSPNSRQSILKLTAPPIMYKASNDREDETKRFTSFHTASFKLEDPKSHTKHGDHHALQSSIEDGARCESPVIVRSGLCRCSNLSTQRGRRNHALMIMLVSVVPVIALLIQNSIDVYEQSARLEQHSVVKAEILFSVETGNVIHRTQIERGTTALYVSSKGDHGVLINLTAAYQETDKAISGLTRWVVEPNIDHFQSSRAFHDNIKAFRLKLLSTVVPNITVPEVIKFYSDDNEVIMRWVGQFIQHSKSGDLWKTLMGYYMLILSKEQAGVERALGSTFYAQGGYNNKQMLDYLERKILGKTYLDRCTEYSTNINNYLRSVFIGQETDIYLQSMRTEILSNSLNASDVKMGTMWFNNMTKYINILKAAQDSLASDVILGLQEEVDGLKEALVESISVMIAALVLFPLVILAVYRLTHRIQAYAQTLQERTRDLDIERKRSETLLFELLPVSVAQKLLNHEDVPPVSYAAVTVFFSDIVGFTNICSRSTPMQVIDMLNSLYRIFDDIIDTYDVYKVETIGDAYMVASGLPQENKDGHATEMAAMALDVRDKLSQMTVQHLPGESLRMRIGLNSGPVVAGVVGHKMPRYCLFGDTVNVASRMESTSLPLKIQITDRTRRELERKGGYVITERGKVEIKGKGEMLTFWLDERSTAASDDAIAQH